MGPQALFGIVTVSHRIGVFDTQGDTPLVRYLSAADGGPVDLADAMPLESFLAPVGRWKEEIEGALESLRPASKEELESAQRLMAADADRDGGAGAGAGGAAGKDGAGTRAFGAAVDAVLAFLAGPTPAAQQRQAPQGQQRRGWGFGAAQQQGDPDAGPREPAGRFPSARVFTFLSGRPDLGPGAIDPTRFEDLAGAIYPSASGGDAVAGALRAADALMVRLRDGSRCLWRCKWLERR